MKSAPDVSVIVCTYNPNLMRLEQTLVALERQKMDRQQYEIIVVDNASEPPLDKLYPLSNSRLVREGRPGLTFARMRGVSEAAAGIIVFVDDDNILGPDYLQIVKDSFANCPDLGAVGGRIAPIWEGERPAKWAFEFLDLLALRDLGDEKLLARRTVPPSYPACAPVGAGMGLRKSALTAWFEKVERGCGPTDRTGTALTSGGDNDIILHILEADWVIAYEPSLEMQHIIPSGRLTSQYLGNLAEALMTSWVETLAHHSINPWPKTSPLLLRLRLLKSYLLFRPWLSQTRRIRWRQARGLLIGCARLGKVHRLPTVR